LFQSSGANMLCAAPTRRVAGAYALGSAFSVEFSESGKAAFFMPRRSGRRAAPAACNAY
jgi:hypothetical protein